MPVQIVKFLVWVQLLLLSLKASDIALPWPWALAGFNIMVFVSLVSAALFLVLWIATILDASWAHRMSKLVVIGTTKDLLLTLTFVSWAFLVLILEGVFTNMASEKSGMYSCIFGAAFCGGLIVLSFVCDGTLTWYFREDAFKRIRNSELDERLEDMMQFVAKEARDQYYLYQVSGTYYCQLGENFRIRSKNSEEAVKKLEEEIKLKKTFASRQQAKYKEQDILCAKKTKSQEIKQKQLESAQPAKKVTPEDGLSLDEKDLAFTSYKYCNEAGCEFNTQQGQEAEGGQCIVCYGSQADIVIMQCGHGGMCCECALLGWKKTDKCHICRGTVESLGRLEWIAGLDLVRITSIITKSKIKRNVLL